MQGAEFGPGSLVAVNHPVLTMEVVLWGCMQVDVGDV